MSCRRSFFPRDLVSDMAEQGLTSIRKSKNSTEFSRHALGGGAREAPFCLILGTEGQKDMVSSIKEQGIKNMVVLVTVQFCCGGVLHKHLQGQGFRRLHLWMEGDSEPW